jgi:bla regulator protein BlaR1
MIDLLASHLWQSTLFAAAAALLTLTFRGNKAHVRYCLWLSASYKFLIPFALLTRIGSHIQTWAPSSVHEIAAATPHFSYTVNRLSQPLFPQIPLPPNVASARAWDDLVIAGLWLCGVVCLALIRLGRWRAIRRVIRASIPANIGAPVETRFSPGLVEPGVVGLMRPVLLLPHGIAEHLTPSEMNAILAHELVHVRHRDNLWAWLHMIVETMFWFHPLVWWIGARLLDERERACDEGVISQGNQPGIYAEAILKVCKLYAGSPLVFVSGVTGSDLKRRIESIMRNRRTVGLSLGKKLALVVIGILVLIMPVAIGVVNAAWAQDSPPAAPPRPHFEVASIKLNKACGNLRAGGGAPIHGRVSFSCYAVSDLIQSAYARWANGPNPRPAVKVLGLPGWSDSLLYDVEAKSEGNAPPDQMWGPMMQVLLEDRFKLKIHRETRELPAYALVVAKGGIKAPPVAEGGCVDLNVNELKLSQEPGAPFPKLCGRPVSGAKGGNLSLDVFGGTMRRLCDLLSSRLDRPAIDRTGIAGKFDFHLEFSPLRAEVDPTAGPRTAGDTAAPSSFSDSTSTGPSIFTAMQQQLGLRLEATTAPVEVLMVDHVERPSEN